MTSGYVENAWLKCRVLSCFLKVSGQVILCILSGSAFQILGAADLNARPPVLVRVNGIVSKDLLLERRLREGLCCVIHSSRYDGD